VQRDKNIVGGPFTLNGVTDALVERLDRRARSAAQRRGIETVLDANDAEIIELRS